MIVMEFGLAASTILQTVLGKGHSKNNHYGKMYLINAVATVSKSKLRPKVAVDQTTSLAF